MGNRNWSPEATLGDAQVYVWQPAEPAPPVPSLASSYVQVGPWAEEDGIIADAELDLTLRNLSLEPPAAGHPVKSEVIEESDDEDWVLVHDGSNPGMDRRASGPAQQPAVDFKTFVQQIVAASSPNELPLRSSLPLHSSALGTFEGIEPAKDDDYDIGDTPCPRRDRELLNRATGRRRANSRNGGSSRSKPIRRPAWLRAAHEGPKNKHAENVMSLKGLKNIERPPPHPWTRDERELLCVINRWYEFRNAADVSVIFNSITGLELRPRVIRDHFHNHLRLYGGNAYAEYRRVIEMTPFDDPFGVYKHTRDMIEAEAKALGVAIRHRNIEVVLPSGGAATAKSELTRRYYKRLVRLASKNSGEADSASSSQDSSTSASSILGPSGSKFPVLPRHLAFRVWSPTSRTKWTNRGFISEIFSSWNGGVPPPVDPDSERSFMYLAHAHMSLFGNASVFVSVTTSLLQAINYAHEFDSDAQIAVINLDHISLKEQHKKHQANDLLSWMQSQGQAQWARYKGACETLIWGDIPKEAVICDFPLASLQHLAHTYKDCNKLLSLAAFTPKFRIDDDSGKVIRKKHQTGTIAKKLRERCMTLDQDIARAMGRVAAYFGLGQSGVSLLQIREFVSMLVDGWNIQDAPMNELHAMRELAMKFAFAFPRQSSFLLQDVMQTFIEGIRIGSRNMDYFAVRARRQKHRTPSDDDCLTPVDRTLAARKVPRNRETFQSILLPSSHTNVLKF
ncbi:hypothetical protein BCR34DRAFT_595166 [Clohesyomyces aquaticus]|uniref:DUF7587 domain-containing protein n=1 Tax=Clohesyomyces aquaticus TaxID=1231657 RepID=A0A1Y2AAW4_9PLEO|nr:hypothetical protein BCR34DRAFT_595166 [Clohesyomyces aquaticus]